MKNWQAVGLTVIFTLLFGGLTARWLLGYHTEEPTLSSEMADSPYGEWGLILERYARPDGFDYNGLRGDLQGERVYGFFSKIGPRSNPAMYPSAADRLAYDINAYQALLAVMIARSMPVQSPLEIHGMIEPTGGFGLFQATRFRLDGETLSLMQLERRIRANEAYDPRVSLVLACGMRSCASIAGRPFSGDSLDSHLDDRLREIFSHERWLSIHPDRPVLLILPAVSHRQTELENWLNDRGFPGSFEEWLVSLAPPELELGVFVETGFALLPTEFDTRIDDRR